MTGTLTRSQLDAIFLDFAKELTCAIEQAKARDAQGSARPRQSETSTDYRRLSPSKVLKVKAEIAGR